MNDVAKLVIVAGLALVAIGGVLLLLSKAGVGSLPGDFSFRRGNVRVFFPLGTSILVSIILSLLLSLLLRRR